MGMHARATRSFVDDGESDVVATRLSPQVEGGLKASKQRLRTTDLLIYAVLILTGLAFLLPFYWMIVSALRPTAQFFQLPIPIVPNPPSLENFETLFARSMFARG